MGRKQVPRRMKAEIDSLMRGCPDKFYAGCSGSVAVMD